MLLSSRTMRWLLIGALLLLAAFEIRILATGVWPNIGSAPLGTGCRYWTGLRLVYRDDLDGLHCPLSIDGSSERPGVSSRP